MDFKIRQKVRETNNITLLKPKAGNMLVHGQCATCLVIVKWKSLMKDENKTLSLFGNVLIVRLHMLYIINYLQNWMYVGKTKQLLIVPFH